MKEYGGMAVKSHKFFTLTVYGHEIQARKQKESVIAGEAKIGLKLEVGNVHHTVFFVYSSCRKYKKLAPDCAFFQ